MGNRWGAFGSRDTQPLTDGDPSPGNPWKGIYMPRPDGSNRGEIPPGYISVGENTRLIGNAWLPRPGTLDPGDFNPPFENRIIGSAIYSNPNGDEVMLIATAEADHIWQLQYGKDPKQIGLAAGQNTGSITSLVHFTQAFDKVMLLRFPFTFGGPLVWDGSNAVGHTFDPVAASGTKTVIPASIMGVPFQDRILLYDPGYFSYPERNRIIQTETEDYSEYDDFLGVFRINAGEGDAITSVLPYFNSAAIVFMDQSIHLMQNFAVDPFQMSQRLLSGSHGSTSIRLPVMIGREVMFSSRSGAGIFAISEVIQDQIAVGPTPVSWQIQPFFDRINWNEAGLWACSATLEEYAYFAFPIDNRKGGCNAIAVLHTPSREWHSAGDRWDDETFRINNLLVTLYDGRKRLFGIDYQASRVYLMYEGLEDQINNDSIPVRERWASRGYGRPDTFNRFQRAQLAIRSYDPQATVTGVVDGFNETKPLGTITKDRRRFYLFGKSDFNPETDDPDQPMREDYSVGDDSEFAIENFEEYPDGPIDFLNPTATVFIGNKQQTLEPFQIRQNGRWCSIEVENTNGELDIVAVSVEGISTREGFKTLA
jgi:hypothetical protein